jgi:acyl-coenzyme A thioesterase PaaI-like protein
MGMLSRCYTGYENTVTMDIHVSYLRAVHVGDEAVIKAFVTHAGRSVINLRSELYVNDRLAATADAIFFKTA